MSPFAKLEMSPFMLRGDHGRSGADEFRPLEVVQVGHLKHRLRTVSAVAHEVVFGGPESDPQVQEEWKKLPETLAAHMKPEEVQGRRVHQMLSSRPAARGAYEDPPGAQSIYPFTRDYMYS